MKMIEIARENAKHFQLEPSHLYDDPDESGGENYAGGRTVDIDVVAV
jgi:hypothetical protein